MSVTYDAIRCVCPLGVHVTVVSLTAFQSPMIWATALLVPLRVRLCVVVDPSAELIAGLAPRPAEPRY